MLGDGTISLEQLLELPAISDAASTGGDDILKLSRAELRQATPLMQVPSNEAIERLLPISTIQLLGFYGVDDLALRLPRFAPSWRDGVETEIYMNEKEEGIDEGGKGTPKRSAGIIYVRRDGYALQIQAFLAGNRVCEIAIRDRRLDGGGKSGKRSPLNHFTVNHEATNGVCHRDLLVAELSVHSAQPDAYLPEGELRDFITNPDAFIYPWVSVDPKRPGFDPRRFFPLWQQAFESGYAPWQPAPPIQGFAEYFVKGAEGLLKELGYHQVETVPAWYNAAVFFNQRMGYRFLNPSHRDNLKSLEAALAEVRGRLSSSEDDCPSFRYGQAAWLVALQNIPQIYLSSPVDTCCGVDFAHDFDEAGPGCYAKEYAKYYLGGYFWTNSPSSTDYCARLAKPLNTFS
jgi:hypothetical protein